MKFAIIFVILFHIKSLACSAFFIDGPTKYFAKNFDWGSGQGYIIKNISGQKKIAYGLKGTNQANWTSKYGSMSFNQIGKEFPYGGINEKGLVVEQLWMSESIYTENNNQNISELEWIQYQLDNYSTIDEIILNLNKLTIKPIATIHYFIADRNGNSAVIDFIEGKTVVNIKQGKHQVITNETFIISESYYELNKEKINKDSRSHFDRYCQIKNSLSDIEVENHNQALEILNNSSENRKHYKTYWTILYDLSNLKVYYKSLDNITLKVFNLSEINFESNSTVEASNINQDYFKLENYTFEMNKSLLQSSLKMMNLKMDEELFSIHQIKPDQGRIDKIYRDNYVDLIITFISNSAQGNIYYTVMNGELNFNSRKGSKSGIISMHKKENKRIIYGIPKGDIALACFQDTDLDRKIDKRIFGIPKNYGFSGNKRGFFGTPPKYKDAKFNLTSDTEIIIKIK